MATIEARMTSRRLPGKVLMPAAGEPLLAHLVARLKRAPSIDEIVVATTTNATDDPIAAVADRLGIGCFRGSEDDVMGRVLGAAKSAKADVIVELTGDCPLIDPFVVEQVIRLYRYNPCDYASNVEVRSYPAGMDTQVFPLATLERAAAMTDDPFMREHVTPYIRRNPQLFSRVTLVAAPDLTWPELALTLDEQADYELIKRIFEHFLPARPDFGCGDVIRLLREEHPEWSSLNADVIRPGLRNLPPV